MPPRREHGRGRGRGRGRGPEHYEEAPPPPPPPPPPQERQIEKLFLKQNPPVFDGMEDPPKAETWIRSMERIFDFLRCTDQERMSCVKFQLTGSADFWWETRRLAMTPEQLAGLTWDYFKTAVNNQYIPKSYRKEKETEFYHLEQGKMTVTEYNRAFCDLARYAPNQVNTEAKLAEKFRSGLWHKIGMPLATLGEQNYTDSLARALDIEAVMPKEKKVVSIPPPPPQQQPNSQDKRKWDGDRTPYGNKRQQPIRNPPQYGGRQSVPYQRGDFRPRAPQCAKCFKNHFGECREKGNKCYTCGGNGHFSRECPSNNVGVGARQNEREPRPQLQAIQAEPRRDPTPPPNQQ